MVVATWNSTVQFGASSEQVSLEYLSSDGSRVLPTLVSSGSLPTSTTVELTNILL